MPERQDVSDLAPEVLGLDGYRALYEHSPEGVLFTSPDGRVLAANPAACAILGRTEAEICAVGRERMMDHDDPRWAGMLAERERRGVVHGVARMIRGDGVAIEVEISARIFRTPEGEPRTCTTLRDVTERVHRERQLSARLQELAVTDDLTGLHNRRGFVAIGEQILEVADRERSAVGVMFLDVDNMKAVNDRFGHLAGDRALIVVADALRDALRDADTVARIGGDEFVALAIGLAQCDRVAVERRIREGLAQLGIELAPSVEVEVSIGWATREPGDGITVEDLLAAADEAMYGAKATKAGSRGGLSGDA